MAVTALKTANGGVIVFHISTKFSTYRYKTCTRIKIKKG